MKTQTVFGLNNNFFVGDKVIFLGLVGEVQEWTHVQYKWMVPVLFEDSSNGCLTMVHCEAVEKIDVPQQPKPWQAARLGDPSLNGIWQPTGEKFEVCFFSDDPAGSFHLRERQ